MNTENKLEADKAFVTDLFERDYECETLSEAETLDLLRIAKDGLKYKEGIEAVIEYMDEQWSPRRTAVAWRWKDFEYILGRLKEIQQ